MFDFVVIGDMLVDRIMQISDPNIVGTIDTQQHTVTMPYPGKVNLPIAPEIHPGGNAYNAATCIRTLGLNTAIFTIVGKDQEGQAMMEKIKKLGVDCNMVASDPENNTNSAIIFNISGDRLVFSYHHPREYKLPQLPQTKFVYLTSIGEDDVPLFREVIAQKEKLGFKLIFSPGTLQTVEDFTDIKDILQNTDYLILNKSEAVRISRLNTESNDYLLKGLHRLGPKVVIITRSDRGAVAFDGENILKVGALKVQVVESTGAGDTFSATLGAALASGKDLQEAMELGAVHAASCIGSVGATTGLLDLKTLSKLHAEKRGQLEYIEATSSEIGIPKPSESIQGS